jgi:antitoxin (DNA-binding transcriptional repressor) of toxin-antitoxin stability system
MNTNDNIHEAETSLTKLLVRLAQGDEIIISKSGKPMAR